MTMHIMEKIPHEYKSKYGLSSEHACIKCGVFGVGLSRYQECEDFLHVTSNYARDGILDPFASMRVNGKVPSTNGSGGFTATTTINGVAGTGACSSSGGGGGLGTRGVGATGMPIRRDLSADQREGNFSLPKAVPETRPGLGPETIDRDAYDDFMRGL